MTKSSSKRVSLLLVTACSVAFLSAMASDFGVRVLQDEEGEAPTEASQDLVGHWRFTKIVFADPRDEHLVLHADGTAENWFVTEAGRGEISTGNWSAEGETLTLSFEGYEEASIPFTFFEGGLVLPNIPNQRQIWERIE
jgi:hypothetical protein